LHQPVPERKPPPLPPFRRAGDIFASVAHLLRPKDGMAGSEWAVHYLGYDLAAMPWHAAVLDWLADPETAEVGLMGPAQVGKSEIGLAWIGRCIEHDPGDFLMCQPDKAMGDDFVKRRLEPFIHKHPVLKDCLLPSASADNVFLKQFRGMLLSTIWPVASQFRARPVPNGWLDDYDQFPPDIEGQGDAIGLLDGRQTTFEGRDTKFVSSSPARDDGSGIEAFVASGTDERLMPECPHCGDRFEPDVFRDLRWDGVNATPDQAAASAHVVCPNNGCILTPDDKFALMASMARLPGHGVVATRPEAGKRRRTIRIDGLISFRSWPEIARKWREAQIAWEMRQDEGPLRAFTNVVAGKNYRSVLSGEVPLAADDMHRLKDGHWKLGTVPRGPVCITVAVDVQHDRFECIAKGWADGMESWTIDRWSIDVLEDGLTTLNPFRNPEHWRVLLPLFDRRWKLAGAKGEQSPVPLCVAIDTGGGGDKETSTASENANRFWHMATAAGVHPSRIMLLKGSSNRNGDLVGRARRADQKVKGGVKRNSPVLWLVNGHKARHVLDARLRRTDGGPGRVHYPADFDDRWFEELTAEQLEKGLWVKKRARNETLDLELYAWFALLKPPFAQSRDHFRWLAKDFRIVWASPPEADDDGGAEPQSAAADPVPVSDVRPRAPARGKTQRGPARQRGGWMGRLN